MVKPIIIDLLGNLCKAMLNEMVTILHKWYEFCGGAECISNAEA